MKQAVVLISFFDKEEGVQRDREGSFLCEDERGAYLEELGLVWLKDAPAKKKATKKKK